MENNAHDALCLDLSIYPNHNLTIFTTYWRWRQYVSPTLVSTYKTTSQKTIIWTTFK
jgi:hypothetical protein